MKSSFITSSLLFSSSLKLATTSLDDSQQTLGNLHIMWLYSLPTSMSIPSSYSDPRNTATTRRWRWSQNRHIFSSPFPSTSKRLDILFMFIKISKSNRNFFSDRSYNSKQQQLLFHCFVILISSLSFHVLCSFYLHFFQITCYIITNSLLGTFSSLLFCLLSWNYSLLVLLLRLLTLVSSGLVFLSCQLSTKGQIVVQLCLHNFTIARCIKTRDKTDHQRLESRRGLRRIAKW